MMFVEGMTVRIPGQGNVRFRALEDPSDGCIHIRGRTQERAMPAMIKGPKVSAKQREYPEFLFLTLCPGPRTWYYADVAKGEVLMETLGGWPPGMDHRWGGKADRNVLCGPGTTDIMGTPINGIFPAFGMSCSNPEIKDWLERHGIK